ncbi:MAG TPA: hypothetical protein DCM64_11145 [Gammaproteobacteria bacterium]|nr:hypothetical protein [Gammaproteobacteria bacterium]
MIKNHQHDLKFRGKVSDRLDALEDIGLFLLVIGSVCTQLMISPDNCYLKRVNVSVSPFLFLE